MDEIKDTAAHADGGETKGQRAVRIVCNVLCVLCGLLVAVNLYTAISGFVRPNMPPRLFGLSALIVGTDSMEGDLPDSIAEGALIITVWHKDISEYAVGDVIAFCDDRQSVIGRIYDIRTDEEGQTYFLVKADNHPAYYTDRVKQENLVGRVWLRMEKMGRPALYMDTVPGLILFLGIPWLVCLGIVGYELYRYIKVKQDTASTSVSEEEQ